MKIFVLVAILSLFVPAAQGVGKTEQPLPPGPLIQKVPACADWTVTYQYGGDAKAPQTSAFPATPKSGRPSRSPRLRQERMIKFRDIVCFLAIDESGGREECWSVHGIQWVTPKGSHQRELAMNEDAPYFKADLPIAVFPGFEWIAGANYAGMQNYNEKQCMVFQQANKMALIDAATKLPVLLKTDEKIAAYVFGPTPRQAPELPGEIAQFYKAEAERTAKMMAPGAR